MKKRLLITFAFMFLISVINSFTQNLHDSLSNKVDSLFAKLNKTESPGIAVLVVKDGKVLLQRGYGLANLEYKVPITSTTVFDIASMSKQFTGMAISVLIEQGKIKPDDDIRTYIPELPDFGNKITIGNLVHHTSGLRDWTRTLPLAGWKTGDVISFDQILNMVYHQQDLNFKPGSEYAYSNTGYNVLVELIQRVTGKPFREWTYINIFEPLGMKNTHFHDDYTEVIANKACGYYKQNNKYHVSINNLTALGSSSLYTTIEDLSKWVINLDNPKIGGKSVINQMFQQGKLNNDSLISYAYGLEIGKYRDLKEISHSGSWASFSTYLTYFPEKHLSVVVLQNSPTDVYKATHDVADIYLAVNTPIDSNQSKKSPKFIDLPDSVLNKYTGTYRLSAAWYVTISRADNKLSICATLETARPFNAISDSTFWAYNSPISFYKNNSSDIAGLYYRGMTCPKVIPLNTPWTDLIGEYYSEELDTKYRICIDKDKLVAKHFKNGTINLTPACNEDFAGSVGYMSSVEFFRDKKGHIEGFWVTTTRSRKQCFVKL